MKYINIKKSAFNPSEYVGFSAGEVFRIKLHSAFSRGYVAFVDIAKYPHSKMLGHFIHAKTLRELSEKLSAVESRILVVTGR
jgi:hypothetical protein